MTDSTIAAMTYVSPTLDERDEVAARSVALIDQLEEALARGAVPAQGRVLWNFEFRRSLIHPKADYHARGEGEHRPPNLESKEDSGRVDQNRHREQT